MKKIEKIRTFIALDLPSEIIEDIKKIQRDLQNQNLFIGKITEPQNIHLTLKFLGEIEKEKIEKVKENLKKIKSKKIEAFLEEVGVFSENFIRIIWIKLGGSGVFELQKKIDEVLKEIFVPERRFMSHITIARVKNVEDKKKLLDYLKKIELPEKKFIISKFFLKKSELFPEGPVYENLEEYNLD